MITKNFRLNALANQYAEALYNNITAIMVRFTSWLTRQASKSVELVGGVNGTRQLIDGYALEALKETYPQWESVDHHAGEMRQC
jgi:hypothetical protein